MKQRDHQGYQQRGNIKKTVMRQGRHQNTNALKRIQSAADYLSSSIIIKQEGEPYMPENQEQTSPVFKLDISGTPVMVTFSNIEMPNIKDSIRDILTESYEERIQNTVKTYIQPM